MNPVFVDVICGIGGAACLILAGVQWAAEREAKRLEQKERERRELDRNIFLGMRDDEVELYHAKQDPSYMPDWRKR